MSGLQELVSLNTATAESIACQRDVDYFSAELILRNLAVAADRLTPYEFSKLSIDSVDKVLDIAYVAQELNPLEAPDLQRLPNETAVEFWYRTAILEPLHSVQNNVALGGDYANNKDLDIQK